MPDRPVYVVVRDGRVKTCPARRPLRRAFFTPDSSVISPPELHRLYDEALVDLWDDDAYEDVLEREATEREQLRRAIDSTR